VSSDFFDASSLYLSGNPRLFVRILLKSAFPLWLRAARQGLLSLQSDQGYVETVPLFAFDRLLRRMGYSSFKGKYELSKDQYDIFYSAQFFFKRGVRANQSQCREPTASGQGRFLKRPGSACLRHQQPGRSLF